MVTRLLQTHLIGTDDTIMPMLAPGNGKTKQGRMWVYVGDEHNPFNVFDFTLSRSRDGPATFLKQYKQTLLADGYGGYDGVVVSNDITRAGCWAHARRKFVDAEKTQPAIAHEAIALIGRLYAIEDQGRTLDSEDRLRLLQSQSREVLATFHERLLLWKDELLPKHPMSEAVGDALNQWDALTVFAADAAVPIDNNVSEREMKRIVLNRKNSLFVGNARGGQTAAILASFTSTCRRHNIDPQHYLTQLLTNLPDTPLSRLHEWLRTSGREESRRRRCFQPVGWTELAASVDAESYTESGIQSRFALMVFASGQGGVMASRYTRRQFTRRASGAVAGLVCAPLMARSARAADQQQKPDDRLVLLGLNAMARSPGKEYFNNGHRGASLIAAHWLCDETSMALPGRSRMVELFERNWASTPLCQPFPQADADPSQIKRIGLALADGGKELRQVGHNAIFAMIAIKAFRLMPAAATPQRIDGVCQLIRSFTPWQDDPPDPQVAPPPFADSQAASRFILGEALASIDRFIGFGQGFAGHMLTFGQALVELADMGEVEWAESCRTAFCKYVTVTRKGPGPNDRRIADHQFSKLRPKDAQYWQNRKDNAIDIGHVFKYPYSYYDLLRRADDPELQKAWEEKAYHLF